MKLAIGIDTGGTYTDAVLYDFETKKILGTAKALTTKNDLCVGIGNALDALPNEHFREVRMLSLSTTLATNACVEGKGGAAKLVFFNGDKDILQKYGGEYGLPPVGEILVEPCRTDISGQIGEYPDWEKFERDVRENCRNADGIGVIELYSFKNGAVIEREAKERIAKIADIPVTCGYELFREPNSLQRGAGTLLNAGLYPVIEDFLRAVRRAMRARGIDAPAVIMRSDGSLMSEEFARKHPVETLLCGPAASVAGGCALSREKNAVVVDMGGTTTDIAIVQGGLPVRANDGVTVGKWRTYVDGMLIRTFGLGGDSAVHYRGKKLVLDEYRVVPLCAAASRYPAMRERLSRFAASGAGVHTQFRFEFYMLAREPRSLERYTEREQKLIAALAGGPLILDEAAAAVGQDIYTFSPSRVAQNLGITAEALCELVYREIEHKMYTNIVKILLQVQDSFFAKNGFDRASEHFIEESYRLARGERGGAMIRAPFTTDFKLVGIGAPIRLFLGGVAELLGTEADVPEHGEVANALGAVTGNVYASSEAEIRTGFLDTGAQGYFVYGEGETRAFAEEEEAERYAEELAKTAARGKAADRGTGEIAVTCQKKRRTAVYKMAWVYSNPVFRAPRVFARGAVC